MNLKRLWFALLVILLAACAAPSQPAPAASGKSATPARSTGGTITRALTSEPSTLDPHGAAGSGQNVVLPYLFDTLVYRHTDNSYQPYLAESWQVEDGGKTFTFKLRPGIKFHDGSALDAKAVVYSFERLRKNGSANPSLTGLADIELIDAVDELTVRFKLKNASPTFLGTLSTAYAGIVSQQAVEAAGDTFGQHPVGSGAFKLEQWQQGVAVTLVRNPEYKWAPAAVINQAAPYVERAVFKVIPDASTQLSALQAGDVDVIFVNQPGHVQKLKADKGIQTHEATLNSLIYLGFNVKQAPYDDTRVRQALSHAVNKDELLQTALGGIGQVAFAPLSSHLPGFDPSLKQHELGFDLSKAKALLAEAGYAQGTDGAWTKGDRKLAATLVTSTRAPNDAIATVLQSQLKALGVPLEIKQLESQAAMDAMTKGQYDLMLWRYDWNDADVLNTYLGGDRIGRTNRNFYSNPAVDDLLKRGVREMDAAERAKIYVEAQKLILADAVWQPLYIPVDYIAVRDTVQDLKIGVMGRTLLNDVRVKP